MSKIKVKNYNRGFVAGFTLIELLIVIGIIAVLATVAVIILNPGELVKQARDSNIISNLTTVNKALQLFQVQKPNSFMGEENIVYVSLPDSSLSGGQTSSCQGMNLPLLPLDWSYRCVSAENLKKTDGTGWLPVNFGSSSDGSPISILPVDPSN